MRAMRMSKEVAMLVGLAVGAPLVTQCQAQGTRSGPAPSSPQPRPIEDKVAAETVAKGLEHPWALAFLPDGRILVTERPGRLRIVAKDGKLSAPLARRAGGPGRGPGRPARRGDRSQVRGEPAGLSVVRRAGRRWRGDGGGPGAAGRGRAGGRAGDLPAAAQGARATATSAPASSSPPTASSSSPRATGRDTGSRRRTSSRGSAS